MLFDRHHALNHKTNKVVAFDSGKIHVGGMQIDTAARLFAELGNPTRLDILRLLIKAGRDGLPIGDIQVRLGVPASTLAFHVRGLVGAGLVEQEKIGRVVLCRPSFDRIDEAISFLKEECCAGIGQASARRRKVA